MLNDCFAVARGDEGRCRARGLTWSGWRALLAASFGVLLVVGGCPPAPSDETPTPDGVDQTTTLDVVFDRSGTLIRDGAFFPMNGSIEIGDNNGDQAFCGFVSLKLDSLPSTANVTNVVLNLKVRIAFNDPFPAFGPMTVDHVNVVSGITAIDYVGSTISSSIATISAFPKTAQLQNVAIDVTSQVNADRAAQRPISSFRFRFDAAPSRDLMRNIVEIEASQDDPAARPSATVTTRQ